MQCAAENDLAVCSFMRKLTFSSPGMWKLTLLCNFSVCSCCRIWYFHAQLLWKLTFLCAVYCGSWSFCVQCAVDTDLTVSNVPWKLTYLCVVAVKAMLNLFLCIVADILIFPYAVAKKVDLSVYSCCCSWPFCVQITKQTNLLWNLC